MFAHIYIFSLLILFEQYRYVLLCLSTCINNHILISGYHTLYEWYRTVESEHFPDPTGLRARIEQWTFGLYPACIKYLMSAFDVPEVETFSLFICLHGIFFLFVHLLSFESTKFVINQVMAVTRNDMCNNGSDSFSRGGAVIYYASVFLYFWFFTTPVVSLIFGSYLYICINWLHLHFDEAFSSLRIANYKAFTRFHIKENGDLEVFTLAVDKVKKFCIIFSIFLEEEFSTHVCVCKLIA